jgi:hypothetical protein
MDLSEIISTTIQAGTVSPARAGFGVPLIMAYHTAWAGSEVRRYTRFSQVAADFDVDSMPYKMASAIFAQSIRPTAIKIGRLPAPATAHTQVLDCTDVASGSALAVDVLSPDGTTTSVSVPWNTNIATTLTDLKAALDPISGIGTTVVASPIITVPATTPGEMVHLSPVTVGMHVRDTTTDWDYDDALTAAAVIDGDFYAVLTDCNSPRNMDKVARWALTNDRIAAFGPQYTKPSQFVSGEFAAGADYTALLANDSALSLFTEGSRATAPECAWVGQMLAREPGTATWAFKSLSGIGADTYTATERGQIEGSGLKGSHYTLTAGVGITYPGKCHGGEWIDVVIAKAWLEARLQEGLYAALVNNPKIPYTAAGLSVLTGVVRGVLKTAEERSIIDAGWAVSVTAVADQETADRAARIVRGLEFTARLAGAVHNAVLVGTVTV